MKPPHPIAFLVPALVPLAPPQPLNPTTLTRAISSVVAEASPCLQTLREAGRPFDSLTLVDCHPVPTSDRALLTSTLLAPIRRSPAPTTVSVVPVRPPPTQDHSVPPPIQAPSGQRLSIRPPLTLFLFMQTSCLSLKTCRSLTHPHPICPSSAQHLFPAASMTITCLRSSRPPPSGTSDSSDTSPHEGPASLVVPLPFTADRLKICTWRGNPSERPVLATPRLAACARCHLRPPVCMLPADIAFLLPTA